MSERHSNWSSLTIAAELSAQQLDTVKADFQSKLGTWAGYSDWACSKPYCAYLNRLDLQAGIYRNAACASALIAVDNALNCAQVADLALAGGASATTSPSGRSFVNSRRCLARKPSAHSRQMQMGDRRRYRFSGVRAVLGRRAKRGEGFTR